MITFKTQEDFEDAVMKVLHERLELQLFMYNDFNQVKSQISLYDDKGSVEIASASDYCELPIS